MRLQRLHGLYRPWTKEEFALLPTYLTEYAYQALTLNTSPYLAQYVTDRIEQIRIEVRRGSKLAPSYERTTLAGMFEHQVSALINDLVGDNDPTFIRAAINTTEFFNVGGFNYAKSGSDQQ